MRSDVYDVVVVGAGAAGVAAAIAAAESGSRVALVERGPWPGGNLSGGLPILGCANGRGELTVTGILTRLMDDIRLLGGYVGLHFDWRTMWGICFDPEIMKLAVVRALSRAGVELRLGTVVVDVAGREGDLVGVVAADAKGQLLLRAGAFVDATGDGWLVERSGCAVAESDGASHFQPVSLTFRMSGVDVSRFLEYVRSNPDDLIVAENPFITVTKSQAAAEIARSGVPFVAVGSENPHSRLRQAIDEREMFPTTAFYMWPTAPARREVGLNVTRVADVDGTDATAVSHALPVLTEQVITAGRFLTTQIPGFADAVISAVTPYVGVRETKRIIGIAELTDDDVLSACKREDGIARGSHHIDIHGGGTFQYREYIPDGGSYDIPMGALIPRGGGNVLAAGRCISATRNASGSARVIGSCIATGEAAGVMAAIAVEKSLRTLADVPVSEVRSALAERGALVDAALG